MKEVEILVQVFGTKARSLQILNKFSFQGIKNIHDTYYSKREYKKENVPKEWLRLRTKGDKHYFAYKFDHFDKNKRWIYSDEHETEIKDHKVVAQIIRDLGFKKLIEIKNKKYIFMSPKYEIVLEEVKNLGLFLEVERLQIGKKENIKAVKKEIWKFIHSLGINTSKKLIKGKQD